MKKLMSILLFIFATEAWATESIPHEKRLDNASDILNQLVAKAERLCPTDPHEQWYVIMVELESLKPEHTHRQR